MKSILFTICLFLCFSSCDSNGSANIDITGNWFSHRNTSRDVNYYVETFISKDKFYDYNTFSGLSPELNYEIKEGVLYKTSFNNKDKRESGAFERIDTNTFSLKNNDEVIVFKRVMKGITLEDFLNNKASGDDYWKNFSKRKQKFEN
ncbi:MAG: hypothetical protein HRT67_13455 [Flavobacteriaceae bacterium]|nr:hypothetical protein [Flavobacteriaceae bacterium]